MQKIAITGNIASGKTQAEKIISKKYPVYDTDQIAHEILNNIDDFYGYDVFTDGKIDRKKLGALVFSQPELKKKLEDIVHPQVKLKIQTIFEEHKAEKYVFISIPLLFEAGFENMFDKIILISADKETRLKRLMKRNNYTEKEALKRIDAQIEEEKKIGKSDYVIKNNSDFNHFVKEVEKVIEKITK